ncbi:MAG: hypothetical protein Q7U04_00725 [Bacteriovorax sp.]|nr:hypothetical protein [Bacteriovorax sp.]
MYKILTLFFILTIIVSCASVSKDSDKFANENFEEILDRAEANSSFAARRILEASRSMISNQEIIVGGCWNYINTVYDRAGYSTNQRVTVFKSKIQGPYVKADRIEPGDWLYYVNHSYSDIEHSAIFVAWTDKEKKIALMVSYVGGNQKKPAEYKKYNLNNIYNIIRTRD